MERNRRWMKDSRVWMGWAMALCAGMGNAETGLGLMDGQLRLQRDTGAMEVTVAAPRLDFGTVTLADAPVDVSAKDFARLQAGESVVLSAASRTLPDGVVVETNLRLQWFPKESLLQKQALLRVSGPTPLLREVVLERRDVTGIVPDRADAIQSQPVFLPGGFCGVAFPIASTRIEKGQLLLAQNPGVSCVPGTWWESHPAVFQACRPGNEHQAFRRYLKQRRVPSPAFHVNYNSWWTSPVPYTEKDILGLMNAFDEKLYRPHGSVMDTFCIDMGWSKAASIWEIDPALFPQGFTRIQEAAERMKSQLGLWISPSSRYPTALDSPWAKAQGYEVESQGLCLGGEKYATAFRQRLTDHVARYHIGHLKFDGYTIVCPEKDHGHEPGRLSAERIADGMLQAAAAVHAVNKDTWIETTCFGGDPSPWWLCYFNSVIGSYGDDAPYGQVPAPVYRESYTTARDYYNLQGLCWNPVPPQMQEVLGLIHQSPESFMNDAVMCVLRGHRFLPMYINPRYMDDARWQKLARLLQWARAKAPLMQETVPLLPPSWQGGRCPRFEEGTVMPREPYGYAHRLPDGVMVVLRNPWIEAQTYSLPLNAENGFGPEMAPLHAAGVYPEARVYGRDLVLGATLQVPLAPYETVVLQFSSAMPQGEGPPKPGAIRVMEHASALQKVVYTGGAGFGPDYTSLMGDVAEELRFELSATAEVNTPEAQWLLLLDGAEDARVVKAEINGQSVSMTKTGSKTGWSATGRPLPERWVFLTASVPPGRCVLRATVACATMNAKVSAWLWGTRPGADSPPDGACLPPPERLSLETQILADPAMLAPDAATLTEGRPIERINGVFLDALEPEQATVGWGTLQRNKAILGGALHIGDATWLRGLAIHANGIVTYALDGRYRVFQAWVGADAATQPSVTFEVWVDGQKRWESGLMHKEDTAKAIEVDVAGAKRLELRVGDGGNGIAADHGDWADARLLK